MVPWALAHGVYVHTGVTDGTEPVPSCPLHPNITAYMVSLVKTLQGCTDVLRLAKQDSHSLGAPLGQPVNSQSQRRAPSHPPRPAMWSLVTPDSACSSLHRALAQAATAGNASAASLPALGTSLSMFPLL